MDVAASNGLRGTLSLSGGLEGAEKEGMKSVDEGEDKEEDLEGDDEEEEEEEGEDLDDDGEEEKMWFGSCISSSSPKMLLDR